MMTRRRWRLLLGAGVVALAVAAVSAVWPAVQRSGEVAARTGNFPASCTAGSATVNATADGHRGSATSSGTWALLAAASPFSVGDSTRYRAFVQFSLPTIPQGCALTSATLRVTVASGSATVRTIVIERVSSGAWNEAAPGPPYAGAVTGSVSVPRPCSGANCGTLVADVTSLTAPWFTGAANDGLRLRDSAEASATLNSFRSDESATPPQLVVVWG